MPFASVPPGIIVNPVRCDDHGAIYLRQYKRGDVSGAPVLRLDARDKKSQSFDVRSASEKLIADLLLILRLSIHLSNSWRLCDCGICSRSGERETKTWSELLSATTAQARVHFSLGQQRTCCASGCIIAPTAPAPRRRAPVCFREEVKGEGGRSPRKVFELIRAVLLVFCSTITVCDADTKRGKS